MNRNAILAAVLVGGLVLGAGTLVLQQSSAPSMDEGHGHGDSEDDHGNEAEGTHVEMTSVQAQVAGVRLAAAGPGSVAQTLRSTGMIVFDSAGVARARARFPGIVREVRRNVGDNVAAGDILATVESNASLQTYQVRAPIAGVVIERNAGLGEVVDATPLFVIANASRVWAEIHVFPKDLGAVKVGQRAHIRSSDGAVTGSGVISAVLPVAEVATQTVIARVTLDEADGRWRPGMVVGAEIVLSARDVPLAVPAAAIQTMNGRPTVFVQKGDEFEIRAVRLGMQNNTMVEVREGLSPGEIYAADNSFLMKADAGKATAEHAH